MAAAAVPTALLPFGPLHARLDAQGGGGSAGVGASLARKDSSLGAEEAAAAAGEQQALLRRTSPSRHPTPQQQQQQQRPKQPVGVHQQQQLKQQGSSSGGNCKQQVQFWQGARQLATNPAALLFLCQATVMGFGVGTIETYLFLFLQELGEEAIDQGANRCACCRPWARPPT